MKSWSISNRLSSPGFWDKWLGRQEQPVAVDQAYQQGYDAFRRSLHRDERPHKAGALRAAWLEGFLDAFGDQQR